MSTESTFVIIDRLLRFAPLAVLAPVVVVFSITYLFGGGGRALGPRRPASAPDVADAAPRPLAPAADDSRDSAAGGKYALLIGVHAYDRTELNNLKYPEADVADLAKALIAGGYQAENVRLMTATEARENPRLYPYAANVRRQVELMLAGRDESDTLVVAFSGHGVQFADSAEDDAYFCPADARLSDRSTLVSLRRIYQDLKGCRAGMKLMLVDACRDDPVAANSRSFARASLSSVSRPQRLAAPGGVVALYSCSAGQRSFDYERDHGAFFHFVIAGLKGEAARDATQGVTVPDLEWYVKRKVDDYVRAHYGEQQMPERVGSDRGLMPVVFPEQRSVPVTARRALVPLKPVPSWQPALTRAKAALAARDYPAMTRAADDALKVNPNLAEALALRGCGYLVRGDRQRAGADADRAITLEPTLALGYYVRGWCHHAAEQFTLAVTDFNQAIRLEPNDAAAYNNRGLCHAKLGQYYRAMADLNMAIRLNPRDVTSYRNRSAALAALGLDDLARADTAKAAKLEAQSAARE